MLLQRIALHNYATFEEASFDLSTTPDKPLILFTGNNGSGKTSTLDAFRLALHGRRGFVEGISAAEYDDCVRAKFHNGDLRTPCSVELQFQYSNNGRVHDAILCRAWQCKRTAIYESLEFHLDGNAVDPDIADELLCRVIPPEVLRYSFFDGERIAELADWQGDDDTLLFACINELLGLDLVDQLQKDLDRALSISLSTQSVRPIGEIIETLSQAEAREHDAAMAARETKQQLAAARRRHEQTKRHFAALGGTFARERAENESALSEVERHINEIRDAIREDSAGCMPLLLAPVSCRDITAQIDKSEQFEVINVVQRALDDNKDALLCRLKPLIKGPQLPAALSAVRESLLPKPVALDHEPLNLTIRESSWMRTVFERELPAMRARLSTLVAEYDAATAKAESIKARLAAAPKDDAKLAEVIAQLEQTSRAVIGLEADLDAALGKVKETREAGEHIRESLRQARHDDFRHRRLTFRDSVIGSIINALPEYAEASRLSKQQRFATLLLDSLQQLWHKSNRLTKVCVAFDTRSIDLFDERGLIRKSDLSAAEKQLFAVAFVFALAQLSGRNLPFAIDTPLARLDYAHRRNLLVHFLPAVSHQTILFSTDTEVVGRLFEEASGTINHCYELANYNGGITHPVQVSVAL